MSRGMGLLQQTDFRDHRFPLSAVVKAPAPTITHRYWYGGAVLDQQETPMCVAFSGFKWADAGPVRNLKLPWPAPDALYHECQTVDEWSGENYDGTSVRALFKSLQHAGLVSEYRWAWDVFTIANWILSHGPVVVGTAWSSCMFDPDAEGFIRIGNGEYAGGHAYNLIGVDLRRNTGDGNHGAFRMLNSWGKYWGEEGRAWLSFADFDILLKEGGEACTATEVKTHLGIAKVAATPVLAEQESEQIA